MDYFMLQYSGQQNTAAAGGFGQGVQFSGQQRTATPFDRLKREWEDRKALLERQRLRREEQERLANEARENLLERAKSRDDFLRRWLGG